MLSFMKQSVIRIRPGKKTERGSEIPDWNQAEELEINGCSVQPFDSVFNGVQQDGRVLGITEIMRAFLPLDADVRAGDRIRYQGKVYTIDGEPMVWQSPTGKTSHICLKMKRWEG